MRRFFKLSAVGVCLSAMLVVVGCSDRGAESNPAQALEGFDLLSQVDPRGVNQSFIWLDSLKSAESDLVQSARVSAIKGHYIAMLKCNTHSACVQYHKETMAAWAQSYLNAKS